MIRPPNDESEVIDNSPLLAVPEMESVKYANISNETTIAEFELVETLLQEASIEGYSLSYPSENFPDKFPGRKFGGPISGTLTIKGFACSL